MYTCFTCSVYRRSRRGGQHLGAIELYFSLTPRYIARATGWAFTHTRRRGRSRLRRRSTGRRLGGLAYGALHPVLLPRYVARATGGAFAHARRRGRNRANDERYTLGQWSTPYRESAAREPNLLPESGPEIFILESGPKSGHEIWAKIWFRNLVPVIIYKTHTFAF